MKANYHTHSKYCGHASGEAEEYVLRAIERGLDTIGFACHVPYSFNNGYVSGFRIQPEDHEKYINDVLACREKYGDRIKIFLGYEAEYYPRHFDDMLENIRKYPVDYLILGQHESDNEYDGISNHTPAESIERVGKYADTLIRAMETGLFTYIAHPDLLSYEGDEAEYLSEMKRVIDKAIETDTPLELNLLGLCDGRPYPKDCFFELVGKMGCPVIVGCDAHSPDKVANQNDLEMAERFIKRHGLCVREYASLRKVQL